MAHEKIAFVILTTPPNPYLFNFKKSVLLLSLSGNILHNTGICSTKTGKLGSCEYTAAIARQPTSQANKTLGTCVQWNHTLFKKSLFWAFKGDLSFSLTQILWLAKIPCRRRYLKHTSRS